ncbi:MAG: DedA family protein [Propionibacteriaceae bacterium]|jgi:membrane protein DedA with SNARE-associated domain|nr:DedA family protein [Propionibacteriaceae bacterium]
MTQEQPEPAEKATDEEPPWWDDPHLPWSHQPTKADLACWAAIAIVGVWALASIPLRTILIGLNPPMAAMVHGGRSSTVAAGAWTAVYGGPIVVYWIVASLSLVKFSWVYWWAGHLWGPAIIEMFAGKSDRARRRAERAVALTNRFSLLAIFLTFLPIPFPMPVVFAAIGAAGTRLRRFLIPVVAVSACYQALYLALGWWIGEPAVKIVNLYAEYMWYVTIAVLVGMVVIWFIRSRRQAGAESAAAQRRAEDDPPETKA